MDLLGTFDDGDEHVESSTSLRALGPSLGAVAGLTIAFGACLSFAQSGGAPADGRGRPRPASFIALVAGGLQPGEEARAVAYRRARAGAFAHITSWLLGHRHRSAALPMPMLGLFSLWDPWETHYGEVAREILARDDWVSLWWAQDGWFWSKPILNFWIQSLAMGSLGTHFQPDQMMIGANGVANAHAEWVVRTAERPHDDRRDVPALQGRREGLRPPRGLLGALVLATMPDWFFLAHQTMTDMPFVAAMTRRDGASSSGSTPTKTRACASTRSRRSALKLRVSLWHLVFGAVLLCALPQIIYLLSRNLELVALRATPKGFHFHWDEFKSGSAGNCGLPGQRGLRLALACTSCGKSEWAKLRASLRFFAGVRAGFQGLAWAAVLGGVLYLNWGERRARRLVYIAAWLCAAIATMAKGPAGFGLADHLRDCVRRDEEALERAASLRAGQRPAHHPRRSRSPGTSRCTSGTARRSRTASSSTTCSTAPSATCTTRTKATTRASATTSGSSATRAFPWTGLVPLGLLWGFPPERFGAGAPLLAAAREHAGCERSRRRRGRCLGHARDVVPLRVCPLHVHGHEVPPLHLPGGSAGGDARRRRARRHAGAEHLVEDRAAQRLASSRAGSRLRR